MKKVFLLIMATISLGVINLLNAQTGSTTTTNAEWDAIHKVIDAETRNFFEKKYDKWADTWAHDSSIFIVRADPAYNSQMYGWNTISQNYKQQMQNMPVYTEEQMAPYINKINYRYTINGDMATVSFKEGKTEKEASDEIRVLSKQNGAWKMIGLTVIGTANYNVQSAFNNLKLFIGNWKMDVSSYKNEPEQKGFSIESSTVDVHETATGIETVTRATFTNNGQRYSSTDCEQYIHDFNQNTIKYIDVSKDSYGGTYTQFGRVEIDDAGNIITTIMDADKPTVKRSESMIALQKDGSLLIKNKWFDADGKQQGSNSFTLHRL